jgi:CBS domain-containing protein
MDPTEDETEEEVVKEMIGGSIPRVDAVRGPASGLRFTVIKAGEDQDPKAAEALRNEKEAPVAKSNEAAPAVDPETEPEPELVLKADGDVDLSEVLDPTEVAADAETVHANGDSEVPGDPTEPGSPAWEAMDAATARKWTSILARAKNALGVMGDRELQEVASGNGGDDDVDAAFDLQDASAAVDYAISLLAPFAVDEQSEADCEAADLEGVSKSLAPFDMDTLDLIEQFAPVLKAGRVLSAANEQSIRDAVTSLQGVLSSLPQAPAAEPVAKSKETPVEPTNAHAVPDGTAVDEHGRKVEPVAKAKGDDPAPMIACYNADGDLIGVVAEGDLTAVGAGTPADPSDDPEPDPAPPAPDEPPPAPPAAAGVEEPVAKSDEPQEDVVDPVLDAVQKALAKRDEEHETVVKSLIERLDHLEAQPEPGRGPLLSGVPTGGLVALRGQSGEVNPEFVAVQKALETETDPAKRANLERQATAMRLAAAYSG